MTASLLILTACFLPLFPLSMVFNVLLRRVRNPYARSVLLLAWPQAGLAVIQNLHGAVPSWLAAWALATSLLYAVRGLAVREVGLWTGFLATSAFALLWIPVYGGLSGLALHLCALAFAAPLALLALLAAALERRFGGAYSGLYGGLARTLPRLSGTLVAVVLAATGTPVFPAFFAMLAVMLAADPAAAAAIAGVWLLWTWSGTRLLQGLVIGPAETTGIQDLGRAGAWAYTAVLVALAAGGLYLGAHLTGATA